MSTYARLDPLTGGIRDFVELTQAQFDALAGNPKQAYLKPLVIDAQPVPTATQVVTDTGYVINLTDVHQTWGLRDKTQTELNQDANTADAPNVKAQTIINNLTTRIQLDRSTLTAAQKIAQLESDVVVLLKIALYYVRGMV